MPTIKTTSTPSTTKFQEVFLCKLTAGTTCYSAAREVQTSDSCAYFATENHVLQMKLQNNTSTTDPIQFSEQSLPVPSRISKRNSQELACVGFTTNNNNWQALVLLDTSPPSEPPTTITNIQATTTNSNNRQIRRRATSGNASVASTDGTASLSSISSAPPLLSSESAPNPRSNTTTTTTTSSNNSNNHAQIPHRSSAASRLNQWHEEDKEEDDDDDKEDDNPVEAVAWLVLKRHLPQEQQIIIYTKPLSFRPLSPALLAFPENDPELAGVWVGSADDSHLRFYRTEPDSNGLLVEVPLRGDVSFQTNVMAIACLANIISSSFVIKTGGQETNAMDGKEPETKPEVVISVTKEEEDKQKNEEPLNVTQEEGWEMIPREVEVNEGDKQEEEEPLNITHQQDGEPLNVTQEEDWEPIQQTTNSGLLAVACQDGTISFLQFHWKQAGKEDEEPPAFWIDCALESTVVVDGPIVAIHLVQKDDHTIEAIVGSLCGYVARFIKTSSNPSWQGPFMVAEGFMTQETPTPQEDSVLAVHSWEDKVAIGTVSGRCLLYGYQPGEDYGLPFWECQLPDPIHGICPVPNHQSNENGLLSILVTTRRSVHVFQEIPKTYYPDKARERLGIILARIHQESSFTPLTTRTMSNLSSRGSTGETKEEFPVEVVSAPNTSSSNELEVSNPEAATAAGKSSS